MARMTEAERRADPVAAAIEDRMERVEPREKAVEELISAAGEMLRLYDYLGDHTIRRGQHGETEDCVRCRLARAVNTVVRAYSENFPKEGIR